MGAGSTWSTTGWAARHRSRACAASASEPGFSIVGWASTPFVAKGKGQRGAPNANSLPTNLMMMKGLDVLGCPTVISTLNNPSLRAPRLEQEVQSGRGRSDSALRLPRLSARRVQGGDASEVEWRGGRRLRLAPLRVHRAQNPVLEPQDELRARVGSTAEPIHCGDGSSLIALAAVLPAALRLTRAGTKVCFAVWAKASTRSFQKSPA